MKFHAACIPPCGTLHKLFLFLIRSVDFIALTLTVEVPTYNFPILTPSSSPKRRSILTGLSPLNAHFHCILHFLLYVSAHSILPEFSFSEPHLSLMVPNHSLRTGLARHLELCLSRLSMKSPHLLLDTSNTISRTWPKSSK